MWAPNPSTGTPNPTDPIYPSPAQGTNFRYWGTPDGGQYYSNDTAVIGRQLDQMQAAGVDFVLIDLSGGVNLGNPDWNAATATVVDAGESARARIGRGDQHEPRRKGQRPLTADDRDAAVAIAASAVYLPERL